jgi:hypothetical protein
VVGMGHADFDFPFRKAFVVEEPKSSTDFICEGLKLFRAFPFFGFYPSDFHGMRSPSGYPVMLPVRMFEM